MSINVSGPQPNLHNSVIDTLKDAVGSPHTLGILPEKDLKGGRTDAATMFGGTEIRQRDTKRGLRKYSDKKYSEILMASPTRKATAPLNAHIQHIEHLKQQVDVHKQNPGDIIPFWKKGAHMVRDACRRDTEKARRRVEKQYVAPATEEGSEQKKGEALYNKRHYGHSVASGLTFSGAAIGVAGYAVVTVAASKGVAALHPMVKAMHIPTHGIDAGLIRTKAATGGGITGLRGIIKGVQGLSDISKRNKARKAVAEFRNDDTRVPRVERQMKCIIAPLMSETKRDLASIALLERAGINTTIPKKLRAETTNIRWHHLVDDHLSDRNDHNNHGILIGLFGSKKANGIINLNTKRTRDLEVLAGFNEYIENLHSVANSQAGDGLTQKDISKAQERLANWDKYPAESKNFHLAKVEEAQHVLADRISNVADEAVRLSKKGNCARHTRKVWQNTKAAAVGSLQEITTPVGLVLGGAFLMGRAATRVINPMNWSHKPEVERTEDIDRKAQRAVKRSVERLEDDMTKAIKTEKRGLGLSSKKLIKNKSIILEEQGLKKKIAERPDRDVYVLGTLTGQHNLQARTGLDSEKLKEAAADGFKEFTRNRKEISQRLGISSTLSGVIGKEELMHMQSSYLQDSD